MADNRLQTYADIMACPFAGALGDIGTTPNVQPGDPARSISPIQEAVIAGLGRIDWDATGLPGGSIDRGDGTYVEVDAKGYAVGLAKVAFRDVIDIVTLCRRAAKGKCVDMGSALLNSRGVMLGVGGMHDTAKNIVLCVASNPYTASTFMGENLNGEPVALDRTDAQRPIFRWDPVIEKYIDSNDTPNHGCPARKVIIETPEGTKTNLMYYFWDKMIEVMYGKPEA